MKSKKVLPTLVWFATITAAYQDNPSSVGDRDAHRQGADSAVTNNRQRDEVFDIDITGEASHYAADNFELCDDMTEETCYYYDADGRLTYLCAALVDGGCICPAGEEKCDTLSLTGGAASFCAMACCDSRTEEACYDYDENGNFKTQYCAPLANGGCSCPEGLEKCGGDPLNGIASYCATVCCDASSEEACYDYDENGNFKTQYCAALANGGCSCPEGLEKCDGDPLNGIASYCATICCDASSEETCYDYEDDGKINQYCAAFADGGCPCPPGQEKCDSDPLNGVAGYCATVCCDNRKEQMCLDYDEDGYMIQYCAELSDGGCPCPAGQRKCDADPRTGVTSYCAMVCCNIAEESCSYYDNDGNLKQYCALLADGGCGDMHPADDAVNATLSGDTISTTEYDEDEVAQILHAM